MSEEFIFFTFQVQQDTVVVGDAGPQEVGAQAESEEATDTDDELTPESDSDDDVSWNDEIMLFSVEIWNRS